MTAFDQAWDIVKNPIIPDSIKYHGVAEKPPPPYHDVADTHVYSGKFRDPVDDTIHAIRGFYEAATREPLGEGGVSAEIEGDFTESRAVPVGQFRDKLEGFLYDEEEAEEFAEDLEDFDNWMGHIDAYPPRRGRGTALYNMIAMMLEHQKPGNRLIPSLTQSDEGEAFWGGRSEWSPPSPKEVGYIHNLVTGELE